MPSILSEFRPDHGEGPRRVVEARRRPIQHARERPHCGEAATRRGSCAPPVLLSARSTNSGPSRPSSARARSAAAIAVVIRDQRAQLRGQARRRGRARSPTMRPARSATSSAAGSRPRKPRKHGAAIGAEGRGVVGAQRRPILRRRLARMVTSAGPAKVAARGLPLAAEQPLQSPRSPRSRACDRRRARRAWHRARGCGPRARVRPSPGASAGSPDRGDGNRPVTSTMLIQAKRSP